MFQLSSERDKLRLLAATGLDGAIVMTFDAALAATSAEDFVARILVGALGIGGAAIGFDFHFGKNRGGSPAFLAEQGERLGFAVDIVPPLEDEGRPVSSGAVRAALADGQGGGGGRAARRAVVRLRRGDPRRQARARARLSDRQSQARSGLRAQARHLRGARRRRRHAL